MSTSIQPKSELKPNLNFRYVPLLSWLPRYDRTWLTIDIIAGLTLRGLVAPEAMAYAGIAGFAATGKPEYDTGFAVRHLTPFISGITIITN